MERLINGKANDQDVSTERRLRERKLRENGREEVCMHGTLKTCTQDNAVFTGYEIHSYYTHTHTHTHTHTTCSLNRVCL